MVELVVEKGRKAKTLFQRKYSAKLPTSKIQIKCHRQPGTVQDSTQRQPNNIQTFRKKTNWLLYAAQKGPFGYYTLLLK
jgi:hypothetical protein